MKQKHPKLSTLRLSILAAAASLALAGCGGGGNTGVTPTTTAAKTTTSSGIVTGFGSVMVDGVRINDRNAIATMEQEDGSQLNTELKLGQHVDVDYDDDTKVATAVHVTSEIKGTVEAVNLTAGTLTILGQTVTINADPKLGPVTIFEEPYTKLADIKAGDTIEVNGLIKIDAAGKTTIQATRIEQADLGAYSRVRGVVSDLSTTASTFKVGGLLVSYAGATIKPNSAKLANGSEVLVSIPVKPTYTGSAVNAAVVKVKTHRDDNQNQNDDGKLGGAISKIDFTAKTFFINGVKVDASKATFEKTERTFASLTEGLYVRVKGNFAADGTFIASSIKIRSMDDENEVELHGSILNFVSVSNFKVRGVTVDASGVKVNCPGGAAALANNLQVEVEGHLTSTGTLIATKVSCEDTQEGQSTIGRDGIAGNVNETAKTLVLGSGTTATTVQWTATTLFVKLDPTAASLNGKRLEVEGTFSGTVLVATKIKLDN